VDLNTLVAKMTQEDVFNTIWIEVGKYENPAQHLWQAETSSKGIIVRYGDRAEIWGYSELVWNFC
jgi:hypothetical protein